MVNVRTPELHKMQVLWSWSSKRSKDGQQTLRNVRGMHHTALLSSQCTVVVDSAVAPPGGAPWRWHLRTWEAAPPGDKESKCKTCVHSNHTCSTKHTFPHFSYTLTIISWPVVLTEKCVIYCNLFSISATLDSTMQRKLSNATWREYDELFLGTKKTLWVY